MSALATPTLEQPESTVTCRVLVQPHCGSLLQQHSKWTKKWGQDIAINRAKTAMWLLEMTLVAMHYTKAKFVLVQLGVSTQYAGYTSNRRASITGTAGR